MQPVLLDTDILNEVLKQKNANVQIDSVEVERRIWDQQMAVQRMVDILDRHRDS